jgi:hypothetical protein
VAQTIPPRHYKFHYREVVATCVHYPDSLLPRGRRDYHQGSSVLAANNWSRNNNAPSVGGALTPNCDATLITNARALGLLCTVLISCMQDTFRRSQSAKGEPQSGGRSFHFFQLISCRESAPCCIKSVASHGPLLCNERSCQSRGCIVQKGVSVAPLYPTANARAGNVELNLSLRKY